MCNDPNVIGLDLDRCTKFTINNDSITNFNVTTLSEDSLRSDESIHLLLGEINDPVFGENKGSFVTQMFTNLNNIESLIQNVVVDSVLITYSYTDFYGDLNESNDLEISVFKLEKGIYKDSMYYSNYNPSIISTNLASDNAIYEGDSLNSSYINIYLDNSIGQELIDAGVEVLIYGR